MGGGLEMSYVEWRLWIGEGGVGEGGVVCSRGGEMMGVGGD